MQDLKVVVRQRTVVSRFGCFVFEFWVLCFLVLGAPLSSFGCFVFEIWVLCATVFVFECFVFETTLTGKVLRFRILDASFSIFGCLVFGIWVLRAFVFVFECFVSETTILFMRPILLVLPRLQRGAKCWQTTKLTHRHDTCNYIGIKCERSYAGHSNVGVNLNVQCRGLGYLMSCGKHKLSPPFNPATVIWVFNNADIVQHSWKAYANY